MLIQIRAPKLLIGILLGAAILAGGIWIGSSFPPPNHQVAHTAQYQAATDSKEEKSYDPWWRPVTAGEWIACLTGWLFLATFGLFAITCKGIITQIKDTRILQRAYITVIPLGTDEFVSGMHKVSCDVGIRNVGHLPANNVRWRFKTKFLDDRSWKPPRLCLDDQTDGPLVIAPGLSVRKGIGPSIDKSSFEKARDFGAPENRWLYMWGRVDYEDGFGKPRFTEFCHRYNLFAAGAGYRITAKHARFHQHGNHTDESK